MFENNISSNADSSQSDKNLAKKINYNSDSSQTLSAAADKPIVSFSYFVKYKLPLYKEELESLMQQAKLTPARYSAQNSPTLFSMFSFNQEQITLQIAYSMLRTIEEIQKTRHKMKKLIGLHKVKLPACYRALAINIDEINAQLQLFTNNELPDVIDANTRFVGILVLDFLEVIHALHAKSIKNSTTFALVIKTLTPGLEEKLPLFPYKIELMQERIDKFDIISKDESHFNIKDNLVDEKYPESTLKNLYSKLNLNFHKWPIFKHKTPSLRLTTIDESNEEETSENSLQN